MKAIAYNPNCFVNAQGNDWTRYRSLFKLIGFGVSFVDRTGCIKTPVDTITLPEFAIPEYDANFNLNYNDCCLTRARELATLQERIDCPIRIMYSGGIDSSLILSSFIQSIGLSNSAKRIEIVMNYDSVHENPWMWEKFIRPNFKVINSDLHGSFWNQDYILVGGEGNDQLLGTDIYMDIVAKYGDGILDKMYTEDLIRDYFVRRGLTETEQDLWIGLFREQSKHCPTPINTIAEYWWWINFSCKWASVYHRMMFYVQDSSNISSKYLSMYYQQFFNTNYFQQWSLKDRDHKHQGNYITYKFHARELIADFMSAPGYLKKIKYPSLSNVTKFKYACDLIDSNYKLQYKIEPLDWYNPDNSFNKLLS